MLTFSQEFKTCFQVLKKLLADYTEEQNDFQPEIQCAYYLQRKSGGRK